VTHTEWLASLQVGDRVYVDCPNPRVELVERATKLHVVVNDRKYRRSTGHPVFRDRWVNEVLRDPSTARAPALNGRIA